MTIDNDRKNKKTDDEYEALQGDLGALLRDYKEGANLTSAQIAEALCIPVATVDKLENEDFSNLPESPYIRGYLRNYARLAERDPSQVIAIYDGLRGVKSDENILNLASAAHTSLSGDNNANSLLRWLWPLLLISLLVLLTMNENVREKATSLWDEITAPSRAVDKAFVEDEYSLGASLTGDIKGNFPSLDSPTNSLPENSPLLASEQVGIATSQQNTSLPVNMSVTTLDQAMEVVNNDINSEKETPHTALPEDVTPTAAGESENMTKVKLVFTKEVWIRIRDKSDKSVFEQVNPAGTEKELLLKKPLKFRVGNARGLKLYVDGERMDITPYIKSSVARFGLQ